MRSPVGGDRLLPQRTLDRARVVLPGLLLIVVLFYQWVEAGALQGAWARVTNVAVMLLMGPVLSWWGLSAAERLLSRLIQSEAASAEKSRMLEAHNRQLQTILAASRSISSVLDLPAVAHAVVEQAVVQTRFTQATLVLGPDQGGRYRMVASTGLPEEHLGALMAALEGRDRTSSPVEWCRLTMQPVVVEDMAGDFRIGAIRSLFQAVGASAIVTVPLLVGSRFIGALTVYLDRKAVLSTAEVSVISALAGQAALALENARLYTLTHANRTRLDKALEFLEAIASALAKTRMGEAPVVRLVAQATANLFEPAVVRIVTQGEDGHGAAQMVTESCGGLTGPSRMIKLPVTLDGQSFGHLELHVPSDRGALDTDDQRILQAFVHLTASALGNASLVKDMQQAVHQVEQAYMGTLEALTKALEMRDHETDGHSRRVVQYTLAIARWIGLSAEALVPLARGALLHDIGKIGIPDSILRKPGPLTEEEWECMKKHPRIGYDMLRQIDFLKDAAPIILHHHERYDGRGYPGALVGEEIPLGARIFAVADAYDAMTSDRPYRKGMCHEWALQEIARNAGAQFDPAVVHALFTLPEEELTSIRGRALDRASAAVAAGLHSR